MTQTARDSLIRILQNAHAGEVAAASAYRGHWKSLSDSPEKEHIQQIEAEEWEHRERVGRWLEELGSKPKPLREKVFWTIGRVIGHSCFVSGWFFPMYFAGRLESQNSVEYEDAAGLARQLGMNECVEDLLDMARVEAEHERFFSETVTGHRLLPLMRRVFGWS
ncbi:MAG TPA: demethoxyubiquinone hydroxylase family protein [Pyrinomonadaceae bacterium]|jgi:rubrerythrin|nr:demethoxyubiquinone hydroxylase family protein [Pyrinomonadaceae bacterium]